MRRPRGFQSVRATVLYIAITALVTCSIWTNQQLSVQTVMPSNDPPTTILSRKPFRMINRSRSSLYNNVWHFFNSVEHGTMIFVYGAYLDSRKMNDSGSHIRMFGVTVTTANTLDLICQIRNRENLLAVVAAEAVSIGVGLLYQGNKYQEMLYSCPVSIHCTRCLTDVSIVFQESETPQTIIPIQHARASLNGTVPSVGVCVATAYGILNPVHLIEWFEFYRLLGVIEFNVYASAINEEALRVFRHYENLGILRLSHVRPPMKDRCTACHRVANMAVLNDCLYVNMERYKYVLTIDFDEFLVPHEERHRTIQDVLGKLGAFGRHKMPAYMFRNAYFFTDLQGNGISNGNTSRGEYDDFQSRIENGRTLWKVAHGLHLTTKNSSTPRQAYHNKQLHLRTEHQSVRVALSDRGYSCKSVVVAKQCLVLQNHYCFLRTPDVGPLWTADVPSSVAYIHHHKRCHFSRGDCHKMAQQRQGDTTATKYAKALTEQVYNTLWKITNS